MFYQHPAQTLRALEILSTVIVCRLALQTIMLPTRRWSVRLIVGTMVFNNISMMELQERAKAHVSMGRLLTPRPGSV